MKRDLIDQKPFDGPVPGDWFLARVDTTGQPAVGEYGYGTKHCTLLAPSQGRPYGVGNFDEQATKFRFCEPWTGLAADIPNGSRVWIRDYYGVNLIMLAEC